MLLARWCVLTACWAVLAAFVLSGCDLVGNTATPTPIPTPALPTPALGPGTFAGTFMQDGRPYEVSYMSLTQTANDVSGYLNIVTSDGKGSTRATTFTLKGTSDSDAVTLNGTSSAVAFPFTVRKTSSEMSLSYPSPNGQIVAQVMTPASQEKFNQTLAIWQTDLASQERARHEPEEIRYSWPTIDGAVVDGVNKLDAGSINIAADKLRALGIEPLAVLFNTTSGYADSERLARGAALHYYMATDSGLHTNLLAIVVVLDSRESTILYGDSLRQVMELPSAPGTLAGQLRLSALNPPLKKGNFTGAFVDCITQAAEKIALYRKP